MTVPLPSQGDTSWYDWATDIHARANALAAGLPGAYARMYASTTAQTLTSGSLTQIALNTVDHSDSVYFFADTAPPGAIQVKQAGRYLVNHSVKFVGGTTGQRFASLQVDWGGTVRESGISVAADAPIAGSAMLALAANQYVVLFAYADGGTSVGVSSSASYHTALTVTYLGPP